MTNETDNIVIDRPLEIDDKCEVLWRDGKQSLRAMVIECRPSNFRKRKKKNQANDSVENLNADEIEYYVHYIGQDR
jgi:hypothetical protein